MIRRKRRYSLIESEFLWSMKCLITSTAPTPTPTLTPTPTPTPIIISMYLQSNYLLFNLKMPSILISIIKESLFSIQFFKEAYILLKCFLSLFIFHLYLLRRFAIEKLPNVLEFFGYVFCFTCLLAGPGMTAFLSYLLDCMTAFLSCLLDCMTAFLSCLLDCMTAFLSYLLDCRIAFLSYLL